MAGYDYYANRDALLRQMAMPRQDFPKLGSPVPVASTLPVPTPPGALPTQVPAPVNFSSPGSNRAVGGVVPSTDPANWATPKSPLPQASTDQLAKLTPDQRSLYDNALAHPGQVTDPYKYATTDFAKLGERPYLDKMQGGGIWEQLYGPPPAGMVYNANGGLMKRPLGEKLNSVMEDVIIGGMTGGIGAAEMAPTIAASAYQNFHTGQADPNMLRSAADRIASGTDQEYIDGSNVGTQATSGVAAPGTLGGAATAGTSTAAGTTGAAGADTGAAATLPDNVDTNGYAKPGYVAAKPGAPIAGYDSTKWNDPAHQSPKYVVGRILSQYPQTAEGLKSAMAEISKAYPGAQQTGDDTISVPGVSTSVDVLKAGGGFWWSPETDENGKPYPKDQGGAGAAGAGAGDTSGGYNASGDVGTSDVIAKIIARLGGMAGGQGAGAGVMSARDALLKQFGVGAK